MMYGGASSILPDGVCRRSRGPAGTIGPMSIPCGCALIVSQREAVGDLAVAVAPRSGADREVDDALRTAARRSGAIVASASSPCDRHSAEKKPSSMRGDVDVGVRAARCRARRAG